MNSPKLLIHEWCVILLFCAILLVLAGFVVIGKQNPLPAPLSFSESQMTISSNSLDSVVYIKIEGQVLNPGLYPLSSNTSLKELLKQAQPLPSADLSQLKWRRKLHDGQTIRIPERVWMTVQITGAVQQPGPLKILSGTRVCEILEYLQVLPEADIKLISKKQRFVQAGEVIKIPLKKQRKNLRKIK